MNHSALKRGLSFYLFLIALLIPLPTKAGIEAQRENARELLDAALAYKMPPGSYKKISVEEEHGLKSTELEYLTIKPDGTRLSRTETEYRSDYHLSRSIGIVNEEGMWDLCDDHSAIRSPGFEEIFEAPGGEPAYKTHALELRRVSERGADYIVITSRSSDAEIAEARAAAEKSAEQLGGNAPSAGARKQLSKRLTDKIPGQVEFWLKEPARHLVAMRYLTKRGALIMEQRVDDDAYERIADLPAKMFTIPADYRRFYPTTRKDYRDLRREHPDSTARLKRKTAKGGSTPPVGETGQRNSQ